MKIQLRNNVIWLTGASECPDWMDEEERSGAFTALLDETTSSLFSESFGDAIENGDASIDPDDLKEILSFKQNPEDPETCELVEPEGITLEPYQKDAVSKCLTRKRFALFFGMGTGKTFMAISILLSRHARNALIVTTKKMISQYRENLIKYAPAVNAEVTNYEMLHKFVGLSYDVLILDESQACKSYSSNANERCRDIAKRCPCCYLFTGTPQDKSRHEILSQLAILDQRAMPTKSRTLSRFFRMDDYYNPKSERRERKAELDSIIAAYSYGRKANELLKLTEAHVLIYRCPKPKRYYDDLEKDRVLELMDGKDVAYVVGDQPSTLRTYLQEICDGTIPLTKDTDEGPKPCPRYIGSTKDATLANIASKVPRGICYFWFRCSAIGVEKALAKAGRTFSYVDGSTTGKASDEAIRAFKSGEVDWLVIQERSGNAGLDLSVVNHVVFYDLPSSYLVYSQCKGRIRRRGQEKECYYHHLLCQGTVEEPMLNALRRKKNFTDKMFRLYVEGENKWIRREE